jgi:hypothetical protein
VQSLPLRLQLEPLQEGANWFQLDVLQNPISQFLSLKLQIMKSTSLARFVITTHIPKHLLWCPQVVSMWNLSWLIISLSKKPQRRSKLLRVDVMVLSKSLSMSQKSKDEEPPLFLSFSLCTSDDSNTRDAQMITFQSWRSQQHNEQFHS